jgi:HK97 family phage portal protein
VSLFFRGEKRAMDQWFNTDPDYDRRAVTVTNAVHLAPVFAAIRHIVDFISTLPLDTYQMNKSGDRKELPLLPLMFRNQNEPGRQGVGQWFGQAAYGMATQGNSVGWITEVDSFGYPTVVNWLKREAWSFDELSKQWYVYGADVPSSRVVHVPWIVPIGHTLGLSPIEHYATIVNAGLSAQEYADVRRGGGLPPTVLKNTAKVLTGDQAATARDRAMSAFASGKPFVTGSDWDLSLTTIPPNHVQFIETLKLTANQIAAIYGVDPREIGGDKTESLTYSTDESRSLNRANNMRPYIVRLEEAFNRLLPDRQYIKLNVDATIRTDIKTRTDIVGAQILDGRLSVNEARALDDNAPVPGGDFHNIPHDIANAVHAPIDRPKGVRSQDEGEPS